MLARGAIYQRGVFSSAQQGSRNGLDCSRNPGDFSQGFEVGMVYRKDIQILRGISVFLIVLFHLELGGVESGFLGVDVFFVISGFLMAILYDSNKKLEFFMKRAKRLLPAYFTTILLTTVVAIFLTLPNEFNQVVKQSMFATVFVPNVGYWLQNSYFSKAEFNPLLHLWSLGVEIQFYLIIPFLFWAFHKHKIVLPLLLLLSLVSCVFVVGLSPKTSFFMMPLRLWEFLIGYCVARYCVEDGAVAKGAKSWFGVPALIILIGIPTMNVDGQAFGFINGHPGAYALVVSLATAIVLAVGIPKSVEDSPLASLLELAGTYSYSIYLVHFPVIVLFLYQPFSGTILRTSSLIHTLGLVTIVLLLSVLMYRLVETPLRRTRKALQWLIALPCIAFVLSIGGPLIQKLKFSEHEMLVFGAWEDRDTYRCGKLSRLFEPTAVSCEITTRIENPTQRILLVGNSHADSIKSTFASVAQSLNVTVRFIVPNEPLMDGRLGSRQIVEEAKSHGANAIFLHYSPNAVDISVVGELVELTKNEGIFLAYIMPAPTWSAHIPEVLWKNIRFNEGLPRQSLEEHENSNRKFYDELSTMTSKNFRVYRVGHLFCETLCLIIDGEGKPLYFDKNHLTLTGSELLRKFFKDAITDGDGFTDHIAKDL